MTRQSNNGASNLSRVVNAYDQNALRTICEMSETKFGSAFGLKRVSVQQNGPSNYYFYQDNGADILAVAHLDTVSDARERTARFVKSASGPVVFSRALDDRLGAYTILDMLPKLGVKVDVLLTVGEEDGQSTAAFFESDKGYNWGIEFDRGGTDVVTYQYEDQETTDMVQATGTRVGNGSFSDISYLEHLEIKMFNWGIGYQDYHSARSHAFLNDTFGMVAKFLAFHGEHKDTYMPHDIFKPSDTSDTWPYVSRLKGQWWNESDDMDAHAYAAYDSAVEDEMSDTALMRYYTEQPRWSGHMPD